MTSNDLDKKAFQEKLQAKQAELAGLQEELVKAKSSDQKRISQGIRFLSVEIDNISQYLSLEEGSTVTNGKQLGSIDSFFLTQGGMLQAWVKWGNGSTLPELPETLLEEPYLENLKIGDRITIKENHPEFAGQSFDITEFRGNGMILTNDSHVFEKNFFQVMESETPSTTVEVITEPCSPIKVETETPPPILEAIAEQFSPTEAVKAQESEKETPGFSQSVQEETEARVLDTDPLSMDEKETLAKLEAVVTSSFYEAGKALLEIRDRKLYREEYSTFKDYCSKMFEMGLSRSYQLIDAANVINNIFSEKPQSDFGKLLAMSKQKVTPLVEVLPVPTSERQVRPLTKLKPDQQKKAWEKAVEVSGGRVPKSKTVQRVVEEMIEPMIDRNDWAVGEVCYITAKSNPDLTSKNNFWGIVVEVQNFSCLVSFWDGICQVKLEYMKKLDYSPEQIEFMQSLNERLNAINHDELDSSVAKFVAALGRLRNPYLSELEEQVLNVCLAYCSNS